MNLNLGKNECSAGLPPGCSAGVLARTGATDAHCIGKTSHGR
jgi:hypothetical protein